MTVPLPPTPRDRGPAVPSHIVDRIFDTLANGNPLSVEEVEVAQAVAQVALDTARLMGKRGVVLGAWAAQQLSLMEILDANRRR